MVKYSHYSLKNILDFLKKYSFLKNGIIAQFHRYFTFFRKGLQGMRTHDSRVNGDLQRDPPIETKLFLAFHRALMSFHTRKIHYISHS